MNISKHVRLPLGCGDWSSWELEELGRLRDAFPSPLHESENGLSEDGDPWWVVADASTDKVLVHITRIDRKYSVVTAEDQVLRTTADIKEAIDSAIIAARTRR